MTYMQTTRTTAIRDLKIGDIEASYPHSIADVRAWEHPKLGAVVTITYSNGTGSTRQARLKTKVA